MVREWSGFFGLLVGDPWGVGKKKRFVEGLRVIGYQPRGTECETVVIGLLAEEAESRRGCCG